MSKTKYKTAVGLQYEATKMNAPQLSVKGQNLMADEIVEIAKRFGVPVVEKERLAKALSALELGQSIPEDLYEAVAVILNEIDKA